MDEIDHDKIIAELKNRCESICMELGLDCIQILASSSEDNGENEVAYFQGSGCLYARIGLAHDFLIEQGEIRRVATRKQGL